MPDSNRLYNIHITFRNTEATEALKSYATDKINHTLQKFVKQDTEAHVVLKVEKNRQIAEVQFHADGSDFIVVEESEDLYASIDKLIDSLSTQLRKHKEKLTKHH
jgi:putative sigma-54 modulation protein